MLGAGALTFDPCLPEEIGSVAFRIVWKGQRVAVTDGTPFVREEGTAKCV